MEQSNKMSDFVGKIKSIQNSQAPSDQFVNLVLTLMCVANQQYSEILKMPIPLALKLYDKIMKEQTKKKK